MTMLPHDIIHMVTSLPSRKAAMGDGKRAPINWGGAWMVKGQSSEADYRLTSETRADESGET
jgi:hypothetical protein